jgi:hypothetical protein
MMRAWELENAPAKTSVSGSGASLSRLKSDGAGVAEKA